MFKQCLNILNCIPNFCCSEAVNVGYVDVGSNYDLYFGKSLRCIPSTAVNSTVISLLFSYRHYRRIV